MDDHSIDRADLESLITEPNSPDPVLESYFRQQLQQRYADPSQVLAAASGGTEIDMVHGADSEQPQGDKGEEYDFPLFARPSASGPASVGLNYGPQRITLRSPSPARDSLGLIIGGRPNEYYFAGDTGPELTEQYTQAAVSGQDIIEGLNVRWRGMELPWRVTIIKATEPGKVVALEHQAHVQPNGRKRSGKKRRIVIRQKLEAKAAKEVIARQNQAVKEAAEREKRTRKNREKKVKKRQKDKLKKIHAVQDPA